MTVDRALRIARVVLPGLLLAGAALAHPEPGEGGAEVDPRRHRLFDAQERQGLPPEKLEALGPTPCVSGMADRYPCSHVDLLSFLPLAEIAGGKGNDIWGWTDAVTGREYALMGLTTGTSFVDVTEPTSPVFLGHLPTHSTNSIWRGIKVYADHAFIVSEAAGHGMQVFDLRQLRTVPSPPVVFGETAHYDGFSNCHTLALNEATGYAYAVGTNTCNGGPHIVDVTNPAAPVFAGCVSGDGYTHETQCVVYHGDDAAYAGREVCFSSNEDTITIVDVTDKSAPVQISKTSYDGVGYTHQGWLTADHNYFVLDDELDEINSDHNTRTRIFNVKSLQAIHLQGVYDGAQAAIDHNLYINGHYVYESNYRAGLRVLEGSRIPEGTLTEGGFFDVYPASDSAAFNGTWSNYPFFESGTVIASGIEQGLFVLRPRIPEFELGLGESQLAACIPGEVATGVELSSVNGYSGSVDLAVQGSALGTTGAFAADPLAVPGTTALTLKVAFGLPGSFGLVVRASDLSRTRTRDLELHLADAAPPAVELAGPQDGATGVARAPALSWQPVPQAFRYQLEVATDPGFVTIVHAAETAETALVVEGLLPGSTQFFWRVTATNGCGSGPRSAPRSFTTGPTPALLVVDDDDDAPDVLAAAAGALGLAGIDYDLWSTGGGDVEPGAATLAGYDALLWLTGDSTQPTSGPGPTAEASLADWLASSRCFALASQDYLAVRGLTPFAQDYLGVASHLEDVAHASVTGGGDAFGGLGPYALTLPYPNRSDALVPAAGSEAAFSSSAGHAALTRDSGVWRTAFLTFGLEGLAAPGDRSAVLDALLGWCAELAAQDGDGDGTANGSDCAPAEASAWAAPGPALDLRFGARDDELLWLPPAEPGATSVSYDLLRSDDPSSFAAATCVLSGGSEPAAADAALPPAGTLHAYLVRAINACGENLGYDSAGVPRTGASCP